MRYFLAFCGAWVSAMSPVMAQPVSYEEALRSAVVEQPQVRSRELQLDARRSAADAADELPDPTLRAGIRNLPVTGPDLLDPTMMTMLEVGVEQQIPNLAERRARASIAGADIETAGAELARTRYLARLGAGEAWVQLAFAQRRLMVADTALDQVTDLVPVSRSAVSSGSARPAETLEVRRAVLEIEDARTAIEADEAAAQAQLARFIGEADAVAVGEPPSADIDPEDIRRRLANHPEILLAGAQLREMQARVDLARSDNRPDFGVSASYGVRERQYGDVFTVMGSITLPLFGKHRQQPLIAAAEAEAQAAIASREDQVRAVAARFEADLAAWRSAYRQWQRAREELLPLARDRATLETASYAAGRAELLDVIAAIRDLALLDIEILEREEATVAAATRLRLAYTEDVQ
ncbi:TolC family protein [Novosphingobium malaysiense]|jgi:outer membrane protein TolC|uniref:Heavy metal RND transporter n=1 Tax=Novosphingobium malaysiense TaxID=1348853 RepID=A0A0B1ZVA7_9SPHN|nr:TolC family protein [Novosphingobium malaysiense]KHK93399.1 heavy metal RND transporter [Novosphingobium malaysiense]MCP5399931.1 TolC family protein [Sphingomonas sp.]